MQVFLAERAPFDGIMVKPFPQIVAWRQIFPMIVQTSLVFGNTARPQAVDKNAVAFPAAVFIYAMKLNNHTGTTIPCLLRFLPVARKPKNEAVIGLALRARAGQWR